METQIPLTPEELKAHGAELAALIREKSLAEQSRADAAKEAKIAIDEMDTRIHLLAKEIREKHRTVPAQQELMGIRGQVSERLDGMVRDGKIEGYDMSVSLPRG